VPPNAAIAPHTGALEVTRSAGRFRRQQSVAYLDELFCVYLHQGRLAVCYAERSVTTMYDALDFTFTDGVPNVLHRVSSPRQVVVCR